MVAALPARGAELRAGSALCPLLWAQGPAPGISRQPGEVPARPWAGWGQVERSLQREGPVCEGIPVQGVWGCRWVTS